MIAWGRISGMTVVLLAAIAAAIVGVFAWRHTPARTIAASTSAPARPATTVASSKPVAPHDFMGVVRAEYPDFPATEPFALPVELHEGARLILSEPLFLDSAQELWITRPDAPITSVLMKHIMDEQTHITRENVKFVHRAVDDAGQWMPQIVASKPQGGLELITAALRLDLGSGTGPAHSYHWDHAFSWNSNTNEGFVVPTDTGVSVFRPRSLPIEQHYDFVQPTTEPSSEPATAPATDAATTLPTGPFTEPQMLLDSRGLIVWMPWENGKSGSRGAARFVDGKWIALGPAQGWPEKLLHLVPLLDGSVIQLIVNDDATVSLSMSQLDPAEVDRKLIDPLIEQLSDPDPKKRDAAYDELTRYGSGLWPVLEKVIEDQPPEGHMRIEQLLAAKLKPMLGRLTLLPGKGHMIARFNDGGALLVAEAGVSVPNRDPTQPATVISPGYISFRPGHAVEQASQYLLQDVNLDHCQIDVAPDEWIVTDEAHGPRRLLGNHLEPILRRSERDFSHFLGIDRRGRWLFRKPNEQTPTLLLDPTLPDATPRLAAWVDPVQCEFAGWDDANWPVFAKGENAWALHAEEWSPLPAADKGRQFYKSMDEMPKPPVSTTATTLPATTRAVTTTRFSTSTASTSATTFPTTALGNPIFTDADGTRYYDGQTALIVQKPAGPLITWSLPPTATGSGEVHLLKAGESRLFLMNQPGRVLRILPTPGRAEPFKLEAVFTQRIPNADHYTRVWLDPAGRIDLVYDTNHLAILFPDGRIPGPIAKKMPAEQLKDDEDERP